MAVIRFHTYLLTEIVMLRAEYVCVSRMCSVDIIVEGGIRYHYSEDQVHDHDKRHYISLKRPTHAFESQAIIGTSNHRALELKS